MKTLALSEPKPLRAFRDKYLAALMMVAALFICSAVSAQTDSAKYSGINGYGFRYKRWVGDSIVVVPLSTSPHTPYRPGGIRYNVGDSTLQLWTGHQWNSIITGGTGIDTAYAYDDSTLAIETPSRVFFVKIKGQNLSNASLTATGDYQQDWANHWFFLNNLKALDINSNQADPNLINNNKVFRFYSDSTYNSTALQLAWGLKDVNNSATDSIHFELNSAKGTTYLTHWVANQQKYVELDLNPNQTYPSFQMYASGSSKDGFYTFGANTAILNPQDSIRLRAPASVAGTKMLALANISGGIGTVVSMDIPTGGSADSTTFATNYRVDTAKANLRTQIAGKQPTGNYITALTGDVTASGPGSAAATIANNTVTNAKAAQMAAHTFKGNNTGSTANASDLTATQLTAELNVFGASLKGLVPAAAASPSSTKYLSEDGTFTTPAGGSSPSAGYGISVSGSTVKVDTTTIDGRYRKVFNVVLYGADPDSNGNDDCPAIKAAVQAAYDAGGGIVYFPLGHYTVGCALQHSIDGVDPDAQIVLPLARDTASKKVRITFEGEAEGNWSAELVTVRPKVKYGVIIESTILDTGFVFGPSFYNDGAFGGDINWNWWGFKNLEIRVRTKTSGSEINNTMSGINSGAPRSVNFDHVKVTVQSSEGNMIEPTSFSTGIILPHWNNNGNVVINHLNVSGFHTGIVCGEHMNATELVTFNCYNGLYLPYAFHSAYISKYTSEGCVNHIYVSNETGPYTGGPLDLHIASYNAEHYTVAAQWNTFASDITFADTSSPAHVYLSYAHMAESGIGKVATFVTNAPYRVTTGFNGVSGASDFLKDNGAGAYVLDHAASTTVDNNVFRLGSTAQTGGFIFGSAGIFDYSSGPHIGARGNTYSAFSNQRGMLFIAGGQVSSPTGNEGSLLFQTQNINRMVIGYGGGVKMPYLTKNGTPADSALVPNVSTGDLELRPIAGASTPSLQTVLNAGRNGDTINITSSSGSGRDISIYNENSGVNDLAVLDVSTKGANASPIINLWSKGTGFSGIQSQIGLGNTSDQANPEILQIRATGTNYIINAYKDASGSLRPIKFQMLGTDVLSLATSGAVTVNASSNSYTLPTARASSGQVLTDVAGNGTLSWETPSGGSSYSFLDKQYTTVSNSGTSLTDLFTYTIPANTLNTDGDVIDFETAGYFNDATSTPLLTVEFNGGAIAGTSTITIPSSLQWTIKGRIIRSTSSTARTTSVIHLSDGREFTSVAVPSSVDYTNGINIKVMGQATGAGGSTGDVQGLLWTVEFKR